MDQKKEIARLERIRLHKKKTDPDRYQEIKEIKEQQQYLYGQGLQALRRYERKVPDCVKTYFLTGEKEPAIEEIVKEFKDRRQGDRRLIRILIVASIFVLTILAIIY